MIPSEIVVAFGLPRGTTHGSYERTLKGLVFAGQQHGPAEPVHSTSIACVLAEIELGIDDGALPLAHISFTVGLEWLGQGLKQSGRRTLVAASTGDGDGKFAAVRHHDFPR